MTDKKIMKKGSLDELIKKLKSGGKRVFAPVEKGGKILFEEVDSASAMAADYVQTTLSAKDVILPRCEEMMRFTTGQGTVSMEKAPDMPPPAVVIGVRPCDARSLAVVNAVYLKDYSDALYKSKIDNTTIIGISCAKCDEYCFCTSVNGNPGDTEGSDILLTEVDGGNYLAEIITEKGKALADSAPELFTAAGGEDKAKHLADVKVQFDVRAVTAKLPGMFDGEVWITQSLRCIGCGTCSYVCPACTCFDIQDETDGNRGVRLRCWDSCGFGIFTLHTSGHNPREVQSQRWRQRIMHKFSYQPDQLQVTGCVGCGRCSRACPVDMNILQHIKEIEAQ
ncbi:MAG TPA: 4Fe-4S dicluster domain-containing protein [Spirochaetota bacterium]|nr:4Fe-4S dicluster domain-containing protein [Spirochaetota bacterium]HPV42033.1 4Fe-4S dicluster domain-containing protein [Spirochaetota bacterium]